MQQERLGLGAREERALRKALEKFDPAWMPMLRLAAETFMIETGRAPADWCRWLNGAQKRGARLCREWGVSFR